MDASEKKFFDEIASTWDSMEIHSLPPKIISILGRMDLTKGMDILDLGTGTGVLLPYLLEMTGKEGSVTGIDASDGMLDEARKKLGTLNSNLQLVLQDFEETGVSGKYDRILLYCVYPHLSTPIATLRRLVNDNLKDGGKLFIAFPTKEDFINSIHREKKIESGLLPSSGDLTEGLKSDGFNARDLSEASDYIVCIEK